MVLNRGLRSKLTLVGRGGGNLWLACKDEIRMGTKIVVQDANLP